MTFLGHGVFIFLFWKNPFIPSSPALDICSLD